MTKHVMDGSLMTEKKTTDQSQFWTVVHQASTNVAAWEDWKKRYVVDIFYEGYPCPPVRRERRKGERRQLAESK